jgi:tetratricopeptide (TPR) repeat protein
MLTKLLVILFFIFITVNSGYSYEKSESYYSQLYELKNEIDSNYYSFNIKTLKSILKKSYSITQISDGDWYPLYYSGFLHYVLGKIYYQIDKEIAFNHFDKSLDCLLKANDKTKSPEILALISASYGKKSALSPVAAIYFGAKAKKYIEDAYDLAKKNPKILLVAATHLMHTPETFGGSKSKAKELLIRCLELNKTKKENDKYLLKWADDAEIYAYLGQLEVLVGNKEKALPYIQKALKLVPDYGFIKKDLMPQWEKIK